MDTLTANHPATPAGAAVAGDPAAAVGNTAGITTMHEHTPPLTGSEGQESGPKRKSPEEKMADLNNKMLKAHKSFAPPAERRKVALDLLDGMRDHVRLATNRVHLPDADVDQLIEGFVNAGIAAATS